MMLNAGLLVGCSAALHLAEMGRSAIVIEWMTEQFAALGHAEQARELALRLLARAQGLTVLSHIYADPDFLAREARELERWVDGLRIHRG